MLPRTSPNGPTTEQPPSWPINEFIASLLKLLVCTNERLGALIRDSVKEMIGSELDPALYHHLFDQIKIVVDRFFDSTSQVKRDELCPQNQTRYGIKNKAAISTMDIVIGLCHYAIPFQSRFCYCLLQTRL